MPDRFYRRLPKPAWLVAFASILVLIAVIGWALARTPDSDVDAGAPAAPTTPTTAVAGSPNAPAPQTNFAPLSIAQSGKGFTLGGELPSQEAKTSLSESLRLAFGDGIEVIDNTSVKPGVTAPDFAALGSILGAAVGISDFRFDLNGDTVTLSGNAPRDGPKTEVQAAVKAAWPNIKIVNNIQVK